MSNRDSRLTKQWKCPHFVTLFCQIIGIQSQSEVTAFCQIMTEDWQVVTPICQLGCRFLPTPEVDPFAFQLL